MGKLKLKNCQRKKKTKSNCPMGKLKLLQQQDEFALNRAQTVKKDIKNICFTFSAEDIIYFFVCGSLFITLWCSDDWQNAIGIKVAAARFMQSMSLPVPLRESDAEKRKRKKETVFVEIKSENWR